MAEQPGPTTSEPDDHPGCEGAVGEVPVSEWVAEALLAGGGELPGVGEGCGVATGRYCG